MEGAKKYDSNLLKGTGLVQETLVLLDAYEDGMSKDQFLAKVLDADLLGKSTEKRVIDIIKQVFYKRYWNGENPVAKYLKLMRDQFIGIDVLSQIFLVYTCRTNIILGDFIKQVYFPFINKGFQKLESNDPKDFIRSAIADNRISGNWSDSTINKVSEHIIATLIDYRLIDSSKRILPSHMLDLTANYLIHELHFTKYSDNQILQHEDWKLFNLDKHEITKKIESLSYKGTFLYQYSGEILRITWKYKNMTEFIKNECRY